MPCPNEARKRSVGINFRCTPEERDQLNQLVALSGMDKQVYIMERLNNHEIKVTPSSRIYKGMLTSCKNIYLELRRIRNASELNERTIEVMETLAAMLLDLGALDKNEVSALEADDADIFSMSRG